MFVNAIVENLGEIRINFRDLEAVRHWGVDVSHGYMWRNFLFLCVCSYRRWQTKIKCKMNSSLKSLKRFVDWAH